MKTYRLQEFRRQSNGTYKLEASTSTLTILPNIHLRTGKLVKATIVIRDTWGHELWLDQKRVKPFIKQLEKALKTTKKVK
jgi:hypothetical protein